MPIKMATTKIPHLFYTALVFLILSFQFSESVPEGALVSQIPGFNGSFPSKHYSGYVTIDEAHGKKLFYYFVLSERDPSNDPVVLWLNGGPGCSSFDGFVYEHGPFNFEMGKTKGTLPKLHLNPYSWSKVSNIIYLDSPAGVGFSYSANESDYVTGDLKTASDSQNFLLKWFELYPEFLSNPFFVSGESYAGIYVPTLAHEVVKGIDAGIKPILNFKGYMVGNGDTDEEFDSNGVVTFAHGMGLISDELFEEVTAECHGNFFNPASDNCENKLEKVYRNIAGLNVYNILEPCYHGTISQNTIIGNPKLPSTFRKLGKTERPLPVRKRMFGRGWPFKVLDDEVATFWLNTESVRKAIHAEQESVCGRWDLCTDRILFNHDSGSMIKYHKNLTSPGYRALIYSGDHDMGVPYTGTEAWTRSLGYKVVDEWRPWTSNGQVAGYLQGYDNNLTFLTIKGCGHTVPEYKPRESLDFYSRWLEGKTI